MTKEDTLQFDYIHGQLPNGWVETTLRDVTLHASEKVKVSEIDKYNYISTENMEVNIGGVKPAASLPTIPKVSKFFPGDILFSNIRTYFRKMRFSDKIGGASNDVLIFRGNTEAINKQFLFYNLSQKSFFDYTVKTSKGTKMPRGDKNAIEKFLILLPPLPEQKAISLLLSSFDNKIELLREQNKTLEQTAQAIFQDRFGKYELEGNLPEGWRVGKLAEFIGEIESGKRPKGGVSDIKKGIPSIGAENVKGLMESNFENVKLIPEDFFRGMKTGKIKDGDILVYKDGGKPGEFKPHFTLIGEGYPFKVGAINEHVFRVQAKMLYQQYYLYFWLNGRSCIGELKSIGGKAAIPGINGTDFQKLTLLIPKDDILVSFHTSIQPIIKKILQNNTQIQSLSKTRDELLPRLMKGEVRVKF